MLLVCYSTHSTRYRVARVWPWMAGLLLAFFSGCTSVPQKLESDVFYKRDMELNVNGFQGVGTLVVPKADQYAFDVRARGDLDLFAFESCHRESSVEDAGEGGIFGDGRRVKLPYRPSPGLETGGSCPVRLGGFEKDRGRHSWAIIDFEGEDATLPALVKCNGSVYNSRGVTICQSKVGLLQEIDFPVQVIVIDRPNCPMQRPVDLKSYRYTMATQECVFRFREIENPHREHRLTTVGYDAILIRND